MELADKVKAHIIKALQAWAVGKEGVRHHVFADGTQSVSVLVKSIQVNGKKAIRFLERFQVFGFVTMLLWTLDGLDRF